LAAALVKFQGSGFAVPRTRKVTVETKTGGSYTFDYAPHELIVAAVRKPLEECGLAVSQTLSVTPEGRPALRTILLHNSGERMDDVFPLPLKDGMSAQEIGSAITYIRRYALSAILGLATEDDDDGNKASGNQMLSRQDRGSVPTGVVQVKGQAPLGPERTPEGGLIGTAIAQGNYDFNLRQTPTGWVLPFRVKNGTKSFIVRAENELAQALDMIKATVIDQRVTVWGHWEPQVIPAKGTKPQITYNVLVLERIATPDGILPAPAFDSRPEALPPPLFDDAALPEPPDDVSLPGERVVA
jgi:hypothetical protein